MCVNNLHRGALGGSAAVGIRTCDLAVDRKSGSLTTRPPSHTAGLKENIQRGGYSGRCMISQRA